jgi:hypothetical protein
MAVLFWILTLCDVQCGMLERTQLVLEPRSLWHLFVLAYIEIYVFRGNPFQLHSLEQSYHENVSVKIIQN